MVGLEVVVLSVVDVIRSVVVVEGLFVFKASVVLSFSAAMGNSVLCRSWAIVKTMAVSSRRQWEYIIGMVVQ